MSFLINKTQIIAWIGPLFRRSAISLCFEIYIGLFVGHGRY